MSDFYDGYKGACNVFCKELEARLRERELQLICSGGAERDIISGKIEEIKSQMKWLDELDDDES